MTQGIDRERSSFFPQIEANAACKNPIIMQINGKIEERKVRDCWQSTQGTVVAGCLP